MSARAVRHVGIVVRDADRSLAFYRTLLGLRVEVDQDERGEFIETILGSPGVRVRTVKLSAPEGTTLIELLQFADAEAEVAAPASLQRVGPTHAALTVSGLDDLYTRLTQQGVEFLSPPKVSADGGARVAFCADPDGTMLELVEPVG
jgi:catechol 2,3-dioxygenase-like lactoylglutathione lyase family enzyme